MGSKYPECYDVIKSVRALTLDVVKLINWGEHSPDQTSVMWVSGHVYLTLFLSTLHL